MEMQGSLWPHPRDGSGVSGVEQTAAEEFVEMRLIFHPRLGLGIGMGLFRPRRPGQTAGRQVAAAARRGSTGKPAGMCVSLTGPADPASAAKMPSPFMSSSGAWPVSDLSRAGLCDNWAVSIYNTPVGKA